jgi:type IV pilus assembly protein PilF
MMRGLLAFVAVGMLAACTTTTNLAGVPEQKPGKAPPESRARVHTELAALYYQQGSFKTALTEIDTALRVDTAYAPAYDMRGLLFMQLGELAQAADSFRQAIALAPADPDIRNNYGWFLCTSGQPQAGLKQLELAWKNPLYDTPGRALANASRCAAEAGDLTQANTYRERAAKFGEPLSEPRTPENLALPNNK